MQIEEGKFYRTDGGEKVGPMVPSGREVFVWSTRDGKGEWRADGTDCDSLYCPYRLVAEWVDEPEALTDGATKYDGSKPPLHLIAPDFLYAVAEILDFGAKKYAPRNWEKGMDWSRVYRAAIGHLLDWFMRKGPDPETGKSHLWHAACCVMFLVCYEIRGVGNDDRP